MRIRTCLAGGALTLVGAQLSDASGQGSRPVIAASSIAFLVAFAQVVNDIADRDLDRLSKPFRPLPAGTMSVFEATGVALGCAVGGLATAALVSPVLVAFAILLLALSWAYSYRWKATVLVGNVAVAATASCAVSFGAVAADAVPWVVLAVQLVVFSFSLAVELLKTLLDIDGDRAAGLTTTAVRFGVRPTALLAAGACVCVAMIALMPALLVQDPALYVIVMGAGGVLPTLVAALLLVSRGKIGGDLDQPYLFLRLAWGAGIVALLLL